MKETVVQDDSNVSDERNWKDGIVMNRCGNEYGRKERKPGTRFWTCKFETINPSGCQVTGYLCQKFGDNSRL